MHCSKLLEIDMIVFIPELDLPTLSRCHIMTDLSIAVLADLEAILTTIP